MSTANSRPESHRSLLKSTSVISAGTLSSRVLGFLRDVILAKLFGTGFQADAFFVALRIPNLFRDLVGEGATNAAVVPVFSEYYMRQKREEFWRFVSVVLLLALVILCGITVAGMLAAPWLVRLIAPGFMADPDKLHLTVWLTRMMFPYLVLIGLTAYSTAVLFTFRSFVVPAFSPCLLNIAMIVAAWFSVRFLPRPVYGLAIGVIVGGMLQLLVQVRPLLRTGMVWYRPSTLNHPGARQIGRLLLPRLLGAGVYQLTVLVDTLCASLSWVVGTGGISAIYYANRLIQFPMGIFGFAFASAALPAFSQLAANKDYAHLQRTLSFGIRNIILVMLPVSVLLIVFAEPIVRILFQRGEFDAYSTAITATAVLFYAIGLFSFAGVKILITAFYALQDTRTPVKAAILSLIINAVLNVLLMFPFKIGGIALASSVAGLANFMLLLVLMRRRLPELLEGMGRFLAKVGAATAITAGVMLIVKPYFQDVFPLVRLSIHVFCAGVVYVVSCYVLGVHQMHRIVHLIQEQWRRVRKK